MCSTKFSCGNIPFLNQCRPSWTNLLSFVTKLSRVYAQNIVSKTIGHPLVDRLLISKTFSMSKKHTYLYMDCVLKPTGVWWIVYAFGSWTQRSYWYERNHRWYGDIYFPYIAILAKVLKTVLRASWSCIVYISRIVAVVLYSIKWTRSDKITE